MFDGWTDLDLEAERVRCSRTVLAIRDKQRVLALEAWPADERAALLEAEQLRRRKLLPIERRSSTGDAMITFVDLPGRHLLRPGAMAFCGLDVVCEALAVVETDCRGCYLVFAAWCRAGCP